MNREEEEEESSECRGVRTSPPVEFVEEEGSGLWRERGGQVKGQEAISVCASEAVGDRLPLSPQAQSSHWGQIRMKKSTASLFNC